MPDRHLYVQKEADAAIQRGDVRKAVDTLSELIYKQPNNPAWSERRAEALLEGRNFSAAIMDFNEAMQQTNSALPSLRVQCLRAVRAQESFSLRIHVSAHGTTKSCFAEEDTAAMARLMRGRALALESDADWKNALADYTKAKDMGPDSTCAHLLDRARR